METIELRESDKRRAVNLNRKNGYGLDSKQMMRLINNHKKGDAYKCALIEFRLTDINSVSYTHLDVYKRQPVSYLQ